MNINQPLAKGILVALVLGLAGCGGFSGVDQAQYDASRTHPISVQPDVATLNIDIPPGQPGLTTADRIAIADFATSYRARGHGPLTVSTPSGSPNAGTATAVLSDVRDALAERGVSGDMLAYTPYSASAADRSAPLILSFKRYVAKASTCGDWSKSLTAEYKNVLPPNFGCATQNNLAAMVADPADLLKPRTMTSADADRRNTVLDKYRQGESTATARSDQDSGAVSKVDQ
ncbi:MAG: CpaD family pilus assembly protein [Parvibaculum sp.]|nr:CpaD family pilus assembly protein [Parvibaculum sp.]MDZ4365522.1 CpaD family pilus assembly protein [Afipia sp.]